MKIRLKNLRILELKVFMERGPINTLAKKEQGWAKLKRKK